MLNVMPQDLPDMVCQRQLLFFLWGSSVPVLRGRDLSGLAEESGLVMATPLTVTDASNAR